MPRTQQMTQEQDDTDILKAAGILSMGYGLFPKMIAKDRRLSGEARSIYAYFCSYAGSGNTAFPRVEMISADLCYSKDRYYRHFNQLVKYGYVSVSRDKLPDGRFSHNVYTLNSEVFTSQTVATKESHPCPQNKATDKKPAEKPEEKPWPQNKVMDDEPWPYNPTLDSKDANSNSTGINSSSLSNPIHSFIPSGKKEGKKGEESEKKMEEAKAIDAIIERCEIEYQNLDAKMPGMEKSVKDTISKMYTDDSITVKKQSLPQDKVRSILADLSPEAILHAVEAYLTASKSTIIINPKQYLTSILCEAQTQATLKNAADFARLEYGSDL